MSSASSGIRYRRVVVTGSAGVIGQIVCRELTAAGYLVRGFDRKPTPQVAESHLGELADAAAVDRALAGTDAVIHLAARTDDDDFLTQLLPSNVTGLYHVMDAAARHGLQRVVLASTIQVVRGIHWGDRPVRVEDGTYPTNLYAATKVLAEAVGRVYASQKRMSVLIARIGWLPRTAQSARWIRERQSEDVYLSYPDAARFFRRALEASDFRYAVVFATSRSPSGLGMDLAPAKALLGYEPQDVYPQGLPWPIEEIEAAGRVR